MKSASIIALAVVLAATAGLAQQTPLVSPEINSDGSVAFRLRAPKAQAVSLRGQWDRKQVEMTKSTDGVWSVTAPGVKAGVWEYSYIVDGLTMIDPANPARKPQRNPTASILHIAGTPPNVWDFQDVPHGTVHQHTYFSKSLGRPRDMWVYTPAHYETEAHQSAKYPLLVLQHGSGDRHETWVVHGKANLILDNLIASGKAKPMIVVMIDGHPLGQVPRDMADRRAAALAAFKTELLEEALPLAEKLYRISPERGQHAIAGLSMGGSQSVSTGLTNLDRFAWIGAFSGVAAEDEVKVALDDATGTNAKLQLLWIACGKDDSRALERSEQLLEALKGRGIRHEWHVTEGDHSWPVWRGYLAEFLPRLFQ